MFSEKKILQILLTTTFENYVENNFLLSYSVFLIRFQEYLDKYKVSMDQVLLFPCVIKPFSFLVSLRLSQINSGSKNH